MSTSEPTPRTIRLVTALLLLATFAAGTVTGGALVHAFVKRGPPGLAMHPMGPMPWEGLDLTEAQRGKAHAVLERYRPKIEGLLGETFPKVREITDQVDREIREILTPEQRVRFDRILAERRNGPLPPRPGMLPPPPGEGPRGPFEAPLGPPGRAPIPSPVPASSDSAQ